MSGVDLEWWRGAVLYEIYPRSFADANGDGVGDLPGITSRLGHVAALGVDAIWIAPFFKSPQKDFGYDVEDYRAVDPLFGTDADLDALLERAHALGLKVLVDFVPAHTSDRHAWFRASRAARTGPHADWYVWADPRPDGTPPNNWLSIFGGPAWTWEGRRQQYWCHHFLPEQPALNLWNPAVVGALLEEAAFWLGRGVDGFRLDAIDYALADRRLRDNPPRRRPEAGLAGGAPGSPFLRQRHLYDYARPELVEILLLPLRALVRRHPGTMLLGEITGDTALQRAAAYTGGGGLDMVYTFDLLASPPTAAGIHAVLARLERVIGPGWICWSFGNHDVIRAATRFGGEACPEPLRALIPILLASLRGTVCLYQGEELGLDQAELAREDIRDPFGRAFWPDFKGRDGCRTPMPWAEDGLHAGFSPQKPWLPVPEAHRLRAVDRQERDPASTLATVRRFLAWRRTRPALRHGTIRLQRPTGAVLAFERAHGGERLLCAFNLSPETVRHRLPAAAGEAGFASHGVTVRGRLVTLPPHAVAFLEEAPGRSSRAG